MPKVKIVFTQGIEMDYYDQREIIRDMTDWEEVTDEELMLIDKYKYCVGPRLNGLGLRPHLVVQDDRPISVTLATIRDIVHKAEEEERLKAQKRVEAKKKRLLTKKEKMKQEYERLKKELGEA